VKLLIDAQLPRRLARLLADAGHDAVHTLDLPDGNRTADTEVCETADREDRIVVTKDQDFVTSFLLAGTPRLLLLISTGNIRNADLESLFLTTLPAIEAAFADHRFVELGRKHLVVHL
jgi:predicted nuclease of predicted toxin-antitoxin system